MEPNLLNLLVGFAYIVVFGGMGLLRKEGVSTQFLIESLGLTALVVLGGYLLSPPANPILFLILLYIFTMRSRLISDLANFLSTRGRQRDAINLLQVALRLLPDRPSRLIVLTNMGIIQLRRKNPASAQALLESVLQQAESGGLSLRHRAACHYNLGIAYQQQNRHAQAASHFDRVVEIFPGSEFARAAEKAIKQRRGKRK